MVQLALSEYFQDIDPSGQILASAPISDGWETEVHSFVFLAQGQRRDLILRLYPGQNAATKAAREFDTLQKLTQQNYPVPQPLQWGATTQPFGKPFVIMEKIEGQPMGALMLAAHSDQVAEWQRRFCRLFVDLHRLDYRPFIPAVAAALDWGNPLLFIQALLHEGQMLADQLPQFAPVLDWLRQQQDQAACDQWAVLHNDFHPFNILVTPDQRDMVIDWGNLSVGDARYDLAWTLMLISTFGRPELRDLALEEYQRLAGQTLPNMGYFEALAAGRRLIEISQLLGGDNRHWRPEAVALVRPQSEHIRRVYALLQNRTALVIPAVEKMIAALSEPAP